MPRRVEQVEDDAVFGKCHHRTGDRNPALLLDLHPVRPRSPRLPARFDLARKMDSAALQQQLLGQRCLTGVGVGNNGKGAAVERHRAHLRANDYRFNPFVKRSTAILATSITSRSSPNTP
jgi:hypothetical protein